MGRLKARLKESLRSAATGAVLVMILGWSLWYFPVGERLAYWSYDVPWLFGPRNAPDELIIVHMDDPSFDELRQKYGQPWERSLHAELLNVLRYARLVVFDVVFPPPETEEVNKPLAEAIRAHGRV